MMKVNVMKSVPGTRSLPGDDNEYSVKHAAMSQLYACSLEISIEPTNIYRVHSGAVAREGQCFLIYAKKPSTQSSSELDINFNIPISMILAQIILMPGWHIERGGLLYKVHIPDLLA